MKYLQYFSFHRAVIFLRRSPSGVHSIGGGEPENKKNALIYINIFNFT